MKKLLIILILLAITVNGFAQGTSLQTWAKSYNKDFQINAYGSAGYLYGIMASAAGEFVISEFNLSGVPLDWGVAVRGIIQSYSVGTDSIFMWGIAPLFNVHLGLTQVPIEFYAGVGLGLYGNVLPSAYAGALLPFGLGFAAVSGAVWHFTDQLGLILEGGYIGYTAMWGIGVEYQF
ncbi:MAG: hypothetical protein JW904_07510 [Spirochaetales bacterium]|nr:hypothetical protein [Spirochaetales bacterium]